MKKTSYQVKNLNKDDNLNGCVNIISKVLGENYIDLKSILSMINDPRFICLKAIIGNEIVGIAIGCIMNLKDALKYLKIEKYEIPKAIKQYNNVAIIKTIAIEEYFQKKGIGSCFIQKMEKNFMNQNIHTIFTVAWMHDNIENIGPLMKKNSYTSLYIIEKYWEADSLIEGFSCPVCGDNGCHCSANIYFKTV